MSRPLICSRNRLHGRDEVLQNVELEALKMALIVSRMNTIVGAPVHKDFRRNSNREEKTRLTGDTA